MILVQKDTLNMEKVLSKLSNVFLQYISVPLPLVFACQLPGRLRRGHYSVLYRNLPMFLVNDKSFKFDNLTSDMKSDAYQVVYAFAATNRASILRVSKRRLM